MDIQEQLDNFTFADVIEYLRRHQNENFTDSPYCCPIASAVREKLALDLYEYEVCMSSTLHVRVRNAEDRRVEYTKNDVLFIGFIRWFDRLLDNRPSATGAEIFNKMNKRLA